MIWNHIVIAEIDFGIAGNMKIYVITSSTPGVVKIGVSNNPSRRSREVITTTRHAKGIAITAKPADAYKTEQMLHRMFAPLRIRKTGSGGTEWFDIRPLAASFSVVACVAVLWLDALEYSFFVSILTALLVYVFTTRMFTFVVCAVVIIASYWAWVLASIFFSLLIIYKYG
jgi:hypothetical protein